MSMIEIRRKIESLIVKRSLLCYLIGASLVSFLGAFGFTFVLQNYIVYSHEYSNFETRSIEFSIEDIIGYVLFAPVIETLLLGLMIKLFRGDRITKSVFCIFPAIVFAVLHALIVPISFLGIFISFYVYSYSYMHWHTKRSLKIAYISSLIPHMVTNGLAILIVFYPLD